MRFEEAFRDLKESYGHLPPDEAKEAAKAVEDLRCRIVTLAQRAREVVALVESNARAGSLAEATSRLHNAIDRLDLDGRTLSKGRPKKARTRRRGRGASPDPAGEACMDAMGR